jgi:hypothetical protein
VSTQFHELRERLLRAGVAPRHVRRYLSELADHFADLTEEEQQAGRNLAQAQSAALVRLGKTENLAEALLKQRQFQSWCARAPWVMFSVIPLICLGAAYLVACLYLWCGWKFFLPGADTPFGALAAPTDSLANMYFQAGKFYYYSAPIFVGWAIGIVAARQRLKAVWPTVGLVLIAWMGATARIQASRTAVPRGLGHINMVFFTLGSSSQPVFQSLLSAFVIFTLAMLPYLVWRLRRASVVLESNRPGVC